MSMPDLNTTGSFCMDPAVVVWTLVRELVTQQRSLAQVERTLLAIQADHSDDVDEMLSLSYDLKTFSDLVALKELWYARTLPTMIAQLALVLEVHETFGDDTVTIEDPVDAALWRSKYFVALEDLTITRPSDRRRA